MNDASLEVLVEHHNNGDHAQNGWKSHVYPHAIRHIVRKTISQSDFLRDWTNNGLSMDRDDIWDKYVEQLYYWFVFIVHANKTWMEIKSYKIRIIKNWESICIIYQKDHANGEGMKICAEIIAEPLEEPSERIGDTILCMIGDMKKDLVDAFKTTELIPLPKATTHVEILDALYLIPDLTEQESLRCYGKLVLNDRVFQALKELPITLTKTWLLILP
ncbi:hypothetical protein ZWY2020_021723 [Hordeum vulgare]|nr:hypothetical protein ZWY2020_021723 [Hordeum vulgare]